jgi:hypothetical protein
MKHARILDIRGTQVLQFVDTVEDSDGETVWAIVTRWINPNQSVVSLQTSYHPEAELEDVIGLMHNTDADEAIGSIMDSFLGAM